MPIPERTCIGCRRRGPATSMVRLALASGAVVAWDRTRPPGRGASLHPSLECVTQAIRTGAFARAFRTSVAPLEPAAFLDEIRPKVGPPPP